MKKPASPSSSKPNTDSPSSYQEIVSTINERRRYIEGYTDQHQHHQNIPVVVGEKSSNKKKNIEFSKKELNF